MENNNIERVVLFHDIDSSKRIGMQKYGSRYLVSWDIVNNAIEDAQNKLIEFEPINPLKLNKSKGKFVRVTIDDGGGSSIEIARHLEKKNIKAYFFIPTKFIGNKGFLDKDEIKEINDMGHIIGSHSHSHPNPFCELTKNMIHLEVAKSKQILEQILGKDVDTFSVPGGEIRKDTLITLCDEILELKEIYISTPYQGTYFLNSKIKQKIFGRLCIEKNMPYNTVSNYMAGKGWKFVFIDYQLRRFRRELIYQFNHLFNNQ
jgi:peptidoglycan/xylan/chitin deacetylase (PgdA/CDA1 family)